MDDSIAKSVRRHSDKRANENSDAHTTAKNETRRAYRRRKQTQNLIRGVIEAYFTKLRGPTTRSSIGVKDPYAMFDLAVADEHIRIIYHGPSSLRVFFRAPTDEVMLRVWEQLVHDLEMSTGLSVELNELAPGERLPSPWR